MGAAILAIGAVASVFCICIDEDRLAYAIAVGCVLAVTAREALR